MAHGHGEARYKPGEVAWGAEHHILPITTYVKTILALFFLMFLTIFVAMFDLGVFWNNIIALTIAVTKATLVVMFFMHVKYSTSLTKIYAIGGFVWFLLLFYTLVDYYTRQLDPAIAESWMQDPGSAIQKHPSDRTTFQSDPELGVNVRPKH
jgi:cytochrome c oxidase subunit 4